MPLFTGDGGLVGVGWRGSWVACEQPGGSGARVLGAIGGGGRGLLIAVLGEVINGLDGAESRREDHGRRGHVIWGRKTMAWTRSSS